MSILPPDSMLGWDALYGPETNFGYTGGWSEFCSDQFLLLMVMVNILIIIGVSTVFAEEYSLKTAGILLTTEHGRGKGILMKTAAAFSYSILLYALFLVFCLGLIAGFYGMEGLPASAVYGGVETYMIPGSQHWTMGVYILTLCGYGLLGCLMTTAVTLLVSALSRQTFGAVVTGAAAFAIPCLIWLFLLSNIAQTPVVRVIRRFLFCTPVFLPFLWAAYLGEGRGWFLTLSCVAAVLLAGGTCLGYRKYKNHQVK